ncbi:hypothetical protein BGZ49_003402 [Haplosporangium sp. Z 27]|nr:hypothetical protein BGZ49_003402 [Haplosporangium sp. Z 27]
MVWKRTSDILQPRRPGSSYFLDMAEKAKADPKEYVTYRRGQSAISPAKVAAEWNKFMKQLKTCDSLEWRNYATDSAVLTKNMVEKWSKEHRDGPPIPGQEASTEDSPTPSMSVEGAKRVLVFPDDNHSSKDTEEDFHQVQTDSAILPFSSSDSQGSSPSSSSRTSAVHSLSSSSFCAMNECFQRNFNLFSSSSWTFTNGVCFDEVLFKETILLRKESALHSFIVDARESNLLRRLFLGDYNGAIQERLNEMNNRGSFQLEDWQVKVIKAFDSISTVDRAIFEGINSIVSTGGAEPDGYKEFSKAVFFFFVNIVKFYSENGTNNKLPETMLERLYMTLWGLFFNMLVEKDGPIKLKIGEIYSAASAQRRNVERVHENRQANGRKIDAIFYCNIGSNFEVGAAEAGRKDNSGNGTKELDDSVKISKVMKDMLDFVCTGACINGSDISEERKKMEIYGFLMSGLSIEFTSLKHLGGRYFYLNRENKEVLPDRLTDITILKIRRILIEFLELKIRMENIVKQLDELVNGPGSRSKQAHQISPTLTTPPSSPKTPSKKLKLSSTTSSSSPID